MTACLSVLTAAGYALVALAFLFGVVLCIGVHHALTTKEASSE